jgi:hypothetical protein
LVKYETIYVPTEESKMLIPLYIEDEITGLKVPNRGHKEQWIFTKDGIGFEICNTWNDVLNSVHKYDDDVEIEYWPAIKPVVS